MSKHFQSHCSTQMGLSYQHIIHIIENNAINVCLYVCVSKCRIYGLETNIISHVNKLFLLLLQEVRRQTSVETVWCSCWYLIVLMMRNICLKLLIIVCTCYKSSLFCSIWCSFILMLVELLNVKRESCAAQGDQCLNIQNSSQTNTLFMLR